MPRLQSIYPSPSAKPLGFFSSFRLPDTRSQVTRRRYILWFACFAVVALMILGVVFAAHSYYVSFGGQSWLKVRKVSTDPVEKVSLIYLPSRASEAFLDADPLLSQRSPGQNVPFFTCGDQQNSCEAFGQPNICCEIGTTCFPAEFSVSGIFCCDGSVTSACGESEEHPPQCINGTVECSAETGGGCCPTKQQCTPNGCVYVRSPQTINSASAYPTTFSVEPGSTSQISETWTGTSHVIPTITVTVVPEAIQTYAKVGEMENVLEGSASTKAVFPVLFLQCIGCMLVSAVPMVGLP